MQIEFMFDSLPLNPELFDFVYMSTFCLRLQRAVRASANYEQCTEPDMASVDVLLLQTLPGLLLLVKVAEDR